MVFGSPLHVAVVFSCHLDGHSIFATSTCWHLLGTLGSWLLQSRASTTRLRSNTRQEITNSR